MSLVNGTDSTVTVEVIRDDLLYGTVGLARLAPGESSELLVLNYRTGCMTGELIATTRAEGIIDRRSMPFCADDEWVITQP